MSVAEINVKIKSKQDELFIFFKLMKEVRIGRSMPSSIINDEVNRIFRCK
jgi:hypothetical protein